MLKLSCRFGAHECSERVDLLARIHLIIMIFLQLVLHLQISEFKLLIGNFKTKTLDKFFKLFFFLFAFVQLLLFGFNHQDLLRCQNQFFLDIHFQLFAKAWAKERITVHTCERTFINRFGCH